MPVSGCIPQSDENEYPSETPLDKPDVAAPLGALCPESLAVVHSYHVVSRAMHHHASARYVGYAAQVLKNIAAAEDSVVCDDSEPRRDGCVQN